MFIGSIVVCTVRTYDTNTKLMIIGLIGQQNFIHCCDSSFYFHLCHYSNICSSTKLNLIHTRGSNLRTELLLWTLYVCSVHWLLIVLAMTLVICFYPSFLMYAHSHRAMVTKPLQFCTSEISLLMWTRKRYSPWQNASVE